jgi:hypothetical protein
MNLWLTEKFKKYNKKPALTGSWGEFAYIDLLNLIQKIEKEFYVLDGETPVTIGLVGECCPAGVAWMLAAERMHHWIVPMVDHSQTTADKLNQIHADWVVITEGVTWKLYPRVPSGRLNLETVQILPKNHGGLILFSSGTSGSPKIMLQDFTNLLRTYESRHENLLTILNLLGFDHIGGINTLLGD